MEKKTLTKQEKKAELIRTVKFVGFSISAGVIQILSYTLLYELAHFPEWLSYLIALILSIIWNFTLNREFTFKSANNVPIAMLKVAAYYAVFTPLSTLLEKWLTESLGWNGYLVTFLNMFINFVTEYLFDRFVVFRNSIDTNKRAKKGETDAADAASEEIAEEILEKTEEETTE